jgi:hypothetical protein
MSGQIDRKKRQKTKTVLQLLRLFNKFRRFLLAIVQLLYFSETLTVSGFKAVKPDLFLIFSDLA